MLTAELVKVSRRKGGLQVVPRCGLSTARAAELLTELLLIAKEHHTQTRAELIASFDDVVVDAKEEKALRAAKKLVLDRLDFAPPDDVDPPALRAQVFQAAAEARRSGSFARSSVVDDVARALNMESARLEQLLYADLEDAHIVDAAALPTDGALLVSEWEQKELQALLLRCSSVVVDVDATPAQLRRLLRAMKLHQLLYRVVDQEGLVRLVIDGPMGLFSSSTRYGMKLALLLPHIQACRKHRLAADVVLRKGGKTEELVVAGKSAAEDGVEEALPPLVQGLVDELPAALPKWLVAPSLEVVKLQNGQAFVPDVVVVDEAGAKAFVEVLGFWSRPAVWQRVEWAQKQQLPAPAVFCFSDRLRVSEEAIDEEVAGASLVAFKGALSAKKVAEKLKALLAKR